MLKIDFLSPSLLGKYRLIVISLYSREKLLANSERLDTRFNIFTLKLIYVNGPYCDQYLIIASVSSPVVKFDIVPPSFCYDFPPHDLIVIKDFVLEGVLIDMIIFDLRIHI